MSGSRLRVRHFFTASILLEQASNSEEELTMACVAVRVSCFHWSEDGVHDQADCTVGWEARKPCSPCSVLAVDLRGLVHSDDIDATSQQGWQRRHLAEIAQLEEEVLVHQEFIGAVGYQLLRATQRELRKAGVVEIETWCRQMRSKTPTKAHSA